MSTALVVVLVVMLTAWWLDKEAGKRDDTRT
jgi:hypothetical protein